MKIKVPEKDKREFSQVQSALWKKSVRLFCLTGTFIFMAISMQYVLRNLFFEMETFRLKELWTWGITGGACLFAMTMNERSRDIKRCRYAAYIFSGFYAFSLGFLGVLYSENASIFAFYFAFALLLSAFMVPWSLKDLLVLSALYESAYLIFYGIVIYVLKKPVVFFPRYYPLIDGVIFISIGFFISYVVRKKDIERDIENFILLKEVEEKNKQIEDELDLANRVHLTLIPDSIKTDRADVGVSYIPIGKVGGDYAKFRFLDEDRLIFFISDVTGHGVPAALLVNRLHAEFERLARENNNPGILMRELNNFITRDFDGTYMYMSAFCGMLDFKSKKFLYSNHGHPTQYLYRLKQSEIKDLKSQAGLLGVLHGEGEDNVHEHEIHFEPGDHILLFTDGVIEAANAAGDFFGETRVTEFLKKHSLISMDAINEKLVEEIERFSGGVFNDDVFILSIKTAA